MLQPQWPQPSSSGSRPGTTSEVRRDLRRLALAGSAAVAVWRDPPTTTAPRAETERSIAIDLLARWPDHVPLRAELLDALALGLSGLVIVVVVVQRVTAVRHLLGPAGACRRRQQRALEAWAGGWRALDGQRLPDLRARSVARALLALVLLEQVQREALAVDDIGPELPMARLDGRRPAGVRG